MKTPNVKLEMTTPLFKELVIQDYKHIILNSQALQFILQI